MRRLVVLMIIPALTMFIVPALASADDGGWKNFHGTYQMTASGSCLHSSLPYFKNPDNGRWTAPIGSQVYAGVTVANGTWVFEHGKKGTYSQTIYATIVPGGDVSIPVEVRVLPSTVNFSYDITPSGDITVTQANGIQLFGSISIDKKAMTLLSANNVQNFPAPFWNTICNMERTLIKVSE